MCLFNLFLCFLFTDLLIVSSRTKAIQFAIRSKHILNNNLFCDTHVYNSGDGGGLHYYSVVNNCGIQSVSNYEKHSFLSMLTNFTFANECSYYTCW